MAPFWFYISVLIIVSMATLASPISHRDRIKRSDDEDGNVTQMEAPAANISSEIPVTRLSATTFERFLTGLSTGTDVINRLPTTFLNKETTDYLTRETRAARSRSRGRSSNSRSSKRTSSDRSSSKSSNGRSTSGETVPNPSRRRGSSSSSSLTCDDVTPCGTQPPSLTDVIRTMLEELYRILSDILDQDFEPPSSVSNANLLTLINFVRQNGGETGKRFIRRVSSAYSRMGPLWEQCCQTYVVGRRKRRDVITNKNEPIDFGELILALMFYDIQR